MKTLTPTNLIAVEVPKDATYIQVWIHGIGFKTKLINRKSDDSNGFYHLETGLLRWKDFKILGEVTDTEISFDVEPIVKLIRWTNNGEVYISKEPSEKINEDWYKEESFRSLLQSNGLYFENPMGEPRSYSEVMDGVSVEELRDNLEDWQSFESKLIKGKLIILKQK